MLLSWSISKVEFSDITMYLRLVNIELMASQVVMIMSASALLASLQALLASLQEMQAFSIKGTLHSKSTLEFLKLV